MSPPTGARTCLWIKLHCRSFISLSFPISPVIPATVGTHLYSERVVWGRRRRLPHTEKPVWKWVRFAEKALRVIESMVIERLARSSRVSRAWLALLVLSECSLGSWGRSFIDQCAGVFCVGKEVFLGGGSWESASPAQQDWVVSLSTEAHGISWSRLSEIVIIEHFLNGASFSLTPQVLVRWAIRRTSKNLFAS